MRTLPFLLFVFLSACSKKEPEQKPSILSIKELGELATVEYTVTKIIKANDNKTWYKVGDRKILMSCEAFIKAGIDLSTVTEDNFSISGKDVTVTLPQPKIISFNIPPEKIKVEYQELGIFREPFKTSERDQLASQAEAQIRNSVEALGILDQAKANTSLLISNMLKQMGYQNIRIMYSNNTGVKGLQ